MVELEACILCLLPQILEMHVEFGDPLLGVEAHRHEQIRARGGLAHQRLHPRPTPIGQAPPIA
jgi:hypothetical protein